ncbi:response regulator transcription factor [Zobellia galactanivorans]|uniref:Two-component system-Response regulator n=1 Tax=Zobellia galactanivorans (strain DSM 12802 / CCUG 47099 / CIP 106680 / NCIMB 13871 / Dsij) TaxID=63186 RepID=G0L200_ZOBGA|nr:MULTISPECIES: response regulator transcription factor [Zobellia]MBU3027412.1 response regulator transcription factor [Zobellia galactanivorans]MDO6809489.1 response regulator transcription factor [Zobellia galactanivorans]OWW24373.1 DNA-binding response regulator [Zobellia sp. OII3]CAZ94843.1 Two-component system-Response regulator [Zobellia galactanivorans]
MKYNLIIADDHKMFIDGLLSILNDAPEFSVRTTAKNGKQVVKYLDINGTDDLHLLITDLSMPEMDGIALNRIVKEKHPSLKTLVVSMHIDGSMIEKLIQNNVDGYVPKNAEKDELLTAMRTIVKGEKYFSQEIKQAYTDAMFENKKQDEVHLTDREKEVLKLIADEYTTQEIADKLYLSKHTIESYRKNLISKLQVKNLAGLTKHAIKIGLLDS